MKTVTTIYEYEYEYHLIYNIPQQYTSTGNNLLP